MGRKIQDEFTDLPVSRQRKKQLRWKRDGLCVLCGKPRNIFNQHCDKHGFEQRERMRKKNNATPWTPGSPGRVPLEHCS